MKWESKPTGKVIFTSFEGLLSHNTNQEDVNSCTGLIRNNAYILHDEDFSTTAPATLTKL